MTSGLIKISSDLWQTHPYLDTGASPEMGHSTVRDGTFSKAKGNVSCSALSFPWLFVYLIKWSIGAAAAFLCGKYAAICFNLLYLMLLLLQGRRHYHCRIIGGRFMCCLFWELYMTKWIIKIASIIALVWMLIRREGMKAAEMDVQ